jgi:hypothetical protein
MSEQVADILLCPGEEIIQTDDVVALLDKPVQ